MGALGLNTGLLDAYAAAEALIMVMNEEWDADTILDYYSDERRKIFQNFVDPTSTHNKLRVHTLSADTAAHHDWFFRMLAKGLTLEQAQELMKPYFETWRTDMRKAVSQG